MKIMNQQLFLHAYYEKIMQMKHEELMMLLINDEFFSFSFFCVSY